jgi:hypothetical protein
LIENWSSPFSDLNIKKTYTKKQVGAFFVEIYFDTDLAEQRKKQQQTFRKQKFQTLF